MMLLRVAPVMLALLGPLAAAQPSTTSRPIGDPGQPAAKARPAIYDDTADAKAAINTALAKARKNNRRVLIQWGANWCGWCHLLHECMKSDKDIKHELLYEYDLVLVDIGRFDKNMDLAATYGADLKGAGVPY